MEFEFLYIILYVKKKPMQISAVSVCYRVQLFCYVLFLSPALNVTKAYGNFIMFSRQCTLDLTTQMCAR